MRLMGAGLLATELRAKSAVIWGLVINLRSPEHTRGQVLTFLTGILRSR